MSGNPVRLIVRMAAFCGRFAKASNPVTLFAGELLRRVLKARKERMRDGTDVERSD